MANKITDQEIYDVLMDERKIQAIKLYREKYGVGLKESKIAVEKMQKEGLPKKAVKKKVVKKKVVKRHKDEEIHNALREDKKILAIKLYRAKYGVGLKEAKTAVEAIPESFYKNEANLKTPTKKILAKKVIAKKKVVERSLEVIKKAPIETPVEKYILEEKGLDDYIPQKNSISNKILSNQELRAPITRKLSNNKDIDIAIDIRIKAIETELSKL